MGRNQPKPPKRGDRSTEVYVNARKGQYEGTAVITKVITQHLPPIIEVVGKTGRVYRCEVRFGNEVETYKRDVFVEEDEG